MLKLQQMILNAGSLLSVPVQNSSLSSIQRLHFRIKREDCTIIKRCNLIQVSGSNSAISKKLENKS